MNTSNFRYTKSPCDDNPCENGGSCSSNGPNDFKCYCDKTFVGLTCTDRVDVCDLEQPCAQGATCLTTSVGPFYRCLCAWNQGGPQCKDVLVIGKSVGFNGDGFAGNLWFRVDFVAYWDRFGSVSYQYIAIHLLSSIS